jgi:hypothetical protein
LNPPFTRQNVIYGGDTVGGRGLITPLPPHANSEGREWFVNNFNLKKDPPIFESVIYISYLYIDGERSMSGSGGITFAEGRLLDAPLFISGPILLYKTIKHKKIPHLLERD